MFKETIWGWNPEGPNFGRHTVTVYGEDGTVNTWEVKDYLGSREVTFEDQKEPGNE
jgi:hypothetical protein